jgi:hypothetical protein
MNGIATFGGECWPKRCPFAAHNRVPTCRSGREKTNEERSDGIGDGGRRYFANLLPPGEAIANRRARLSRKR